jgi:hypothetical protein
MNDSGGDARNSTKWYGYDLIDVLAYLFPAAHVCIYMIKNNNM